MVLGDIKKAIDSYQVALKHEPKNLFYYYHLVDLNKEILNLKLKNKINRILDDSNCTKENLAYGNFLLSKLNKRIRITKKNSIIY